MIHPTAVIHAGARIAEGVTIGPYAVVDEHVELGPGCIVGPHAYLTGRLIAGARNHFFASCVIGEAPQDLKYSGKLTGVRIGDDNVFREFVTVHRSTHEDQWTELGSGNLLMASSHVGHNSHVGNQVILANGTLLGGYARIDDRAFVSGCCLVHQFTRVGTLALMQGGAGVSKDLPPFTIARRGPGNRICGLNTVGLRRAGFSAPQRLELKELYHFLFRSGLPLKRALEQASERFKSPGSRTMLDFIAAAKRGVCADVTGKGKTDEAESEE